MFTLRHSFALVCLVSLSPIQTSGFSIWSLFARETPTTTEGYKYISVDITEKGKEDTGDKHGGIKVSGRLDAKPTIVVTKTVKHDIIKRVTVNPICVTARADIGPCFQDEVIGEVNYEHRPEIRNRNNIPEGMFLEPSEKPLDLDVEEDNAYARGSKYLYFGRPTPGLNKKKVKLKERLQIAEISDAVSKAHKKNENAVTIQVTQTIRSTRIQKVVNRDVTATLVIENCIPYKLMYNFCSD